MLALAMLAALLVPALASAQKPGGSAAPSGGGGGAVYVPPPPPAKRAKIVNGQAIPPIGAPPAVVNAIAAANAITAKPYVWGGGHRPYTKTANAASITPALDRGYDCSGAVSMALYGGRMLKSPLDSTSFMRWGLAGAGQWVTVYTNPGHAYIVIAGLRFDTSAGDRATARERSSGSGPRWRKYSRKPAGFTARHPNGF